MGMIQHRIGGGLRRPNGGRECSDGGCSILVGCLGETGG